MNSSIDTASPLLFQLLWSSDPASQNAIGLVLAAGGLAGLCVHLPLSIRLLRISLLERSLSRAFRADHRPGSAQREEVAAAFSDSPLAGQWELFAQRWQRAASEGSDARAPVRLRDVLTDAPLLPAGARRSLLPVLPGLFLAVGALGTLVGLAIALTGGGLAQSVPASGDPVVPAQALSLLVGQIGLALRTALWGMLLAISASLCSSLLEGRYEALTTALDGWVERAFGSLSAGELASASARLQRQSLEQLGGELTRFTNDLSERLDRGLQRIETSTANAASLVSEEQRRTLHNVVRELSIQLQQGVEDHLRSLHVALERSVEHQGAVTGGLAATFERMAEEADVHSRVTESLERAALTVQAASEALSTAAHAFSPTFERLHAIDKTLDALRAEIREEGRRLRVSASELGQRLQPASGGAPQPVAFRSGASSELTQAAEPVASPPPLSRLARSQASSLSRPASRGGPAGLTLGPDPYARVEPDVHTGSAYAESSATREQTEPVHAREELRLSELLGSRAGCDAEAGTDLSGVSTAPPVLAAGGSPAAQEPDEPGATPLPRSWRFLGRS